MVPEAAKLSFQAQNNFLQRPISLWFWIVSNPIGVVD
jgi:hypothetical protein